MLVGKENIVIKKENTLYKYRDRIRYEYANIRVGSQECY